MKVGYDNRVTSLSMCNVEDRVEKRMLHLYIRQTRPGNAEADVWTHDSGGPF